VVSRVAELRSHERGVKDGTGSNMNIAGCTSVFVDYFLR
jgi:hypothetical protein